MSDQAPRPAELGQAGSVPDVVARMARIPAFSWHVKARLILGVGTFFDAFDLLAISFALPAFIGTWHMTPGQIGGVLSAAFIGQLVGALLGGWFAERWGRLHVVNIAIALFSVMSLACAFASSVGGAWQRVAAAIGPLVVGWLLPAYGIGPIFIYFGALAILGAAITWAFAIETAGRELEELSP